MNDINVIVIKRAGRKFFEARWVDPVTNRKRTQSTGKAKRRDAERVAGQIEKELREGTYRKNKRVTWAEFRERYESEYLAGKAKKTAEKAATAFRAVERVIDPYFLVALDEGRLGAFIEKLRAEKLSESTIHGYLAHLKAGLRWAHRRKLLPVVPNFDMPSAGGMKGRPITAEEFERMLAKGVGVVTFDPTKAKFKPTEAVIRKWEQRNAAIVESWWHLLRGLWLSGLRLGEALALHWTDDSGIRVDFEGKRPMFRIQARAEKGRKDRVLPMAPEFAEFLDATPESQRHGFVFNPMPKKGRNRPRVDNASKTIADIGKAAGVKVGESSKGPRFAGAHDLRRAFGYRWSLRVRTPVLMQMMRHESINTTLEYYVGQDAEAAAEVIWDAVGNTSGNNGPSGAESATGQLPQDIG